MNEDVAPGGADIDIEQIRQLLELLELHDVREFRLQQGERKYFFRRGALEVAAAPQMMFSPQAAAAMPAVPAAPESPAAAAPAADENQLKVKSPTVGTFYQSASPGESAFVKVGDAITADTIVCIVEAMKVFNQIPAGVAGTVTRVLKADGDSVEFGEALFLVTPN